MTKGQRDIKRKLAVLDHVKTNGNISQTCRYFGISREAYYKWKRSYERYGEDGLVNGKPCPSNPRLRVAPAIEDKILYLRRKYHFGQLAISVYLNRYHDIQVSPGGVYSVLRRNGMNRLPRDYKKKIRSTILYEKKTPGHHVQVDVKFLKFTNNKGRKIKRFQYTAIDDATRIRALKIYNQHTAKNAKDFVDYVVQKFPFRIQTIRTDNGHEFQWQFHWHVEKEMGITHVYVKPRSPHLNGKVERSHATDDREFYQVLEYKDDIDLHKKLKEWEDFYNYYRSHSSLQGKAPYEILRERLK